MQTKSFISRMEMALIESKEWRHEGRKEIETNRTNEIHAKENKQSNTKEEEEKTRSDRKKIENASIYPESLMN